jgi:hypothetical protein
MHRQASERGKQIHVTCMSMRPFITVRQVLTYPELYSFVEISQNNQDSMGGRGHAHWENIMSWRAKLASRPMPMNNEKIYGAGDGSNYSAGEGKEAVRRFWRNVFAGCASSRFHRPTDRGWGIGLGESSRNTSTRHGSTKLGSDCKHPTTGPTLPYSPSSTDPRPMNHLTHGHDVILRLPFRTNNLVWNRRPEDPQSLFFQGDPFAAQQVGERTPFDQVQLNLVVPPGSPVNNCILGSTEHSSTRRQWTCQVQLHAAQHGRAEREQPILAAGEGQKIAGAVGHLLMAWARIVQRIGRGRFVGVDDHAGERTG